MEQKKPIVTLKELRMLRGFSQLELGDKIGKSQYTILNWESGKTYPDIKNYYKLKDSLDNKDEFFLKF